MGLISHLGVGVVDFLFFESSTVDLETGYFFAV